MIVDEHKTETGWCYMLRCDLASSNRCRTTWRVRRLKSYTLQTHVCKACHNKQIASLGGKRGGPIAGAIAKESGQINQIQPLAIAAFKQRPDYHHVLSEAGKRSGHRAVITGQLEQARRSNYTNASELKKWKTRKKNGTCKISRPERQFLNVLKQLYGDIEESIYVDGFWIDAYIPLLNRYVQFDGVYYHGLDRSYEELNSTQRRKYDIDRAADAHFRNAGKILLRITDVKFASMNKEDVKSFCECHV